MPHCNEVIRKSILEFLVLGTDTFIKLNEEKTDIIPYACNPQTSTCPYQRDHLFLFMLLSQRTISLREALD